MLDHLAASDPRRSVTDCDMSGAIFYLQFPLIY